MIQINENIFITADTHCFILQEKKIKAGGKNAGTEYFNILGYYPTIDSALKGLLIKETRKYVSKTDVVSLKEAIKEVQKIENQIMTSRNKSKTSVEKRSKA